MSSGRIGTATYIINTRKGQGIRWFDQRRKSHMADMSYKCNICKKQIKPKENIIWNWKTETIRHGACDAMKKRKTKGSKTKGSRRHA